MCAQGTCWVSLICTLSRRKQEKKHWNLKTYHLTPGLNFLIINQKIVTREIKLGLWETLRWSHGWNCPFNAFPLFWLDRVHTEKKGKWLRRQPPGDRSSDAAMLKPNLQRNHLYNLYVALNRAHKCMGSQQSGSYWVQDTQKMTKGAYFYPCSSLYLPCIGP